MGKNIIEKAITVCANTAGDIATAAMSEMVFPGSSLIGGVVGEVVTIVTEDIAQRMLSVAEKKRLIYVEECIVDKVNKRLAAGEQPRRDEEFYVKDEYEQTSASKLLEEVLLKCKQEFEAKKLKSFGNFWSNICFENGVTYEAANSIITQFASLSYQQVKILTYLNTGAIIPLGKWEKYMFSNETVAPYYTVYSDCLHLYNVRLAAQKDTDKGVRLGTPDICISPSGKLMCRLLELELTELEFKEISTLIQNIDAIVSRLMKEAKDDGSDRLLTAITKDEIEKAFEVKGPEIIEEARLQWDVEDGTLSIK